MKLILILFSEHRAVALFFFFFLQRGHMGTSCEIYETMATTGEQAKPSKGCQFTSQITFATEGEIF